MTEIDSAAFEAEIATCMFTAGRIDSAGTSDSAHFSDALGRIYVTAQAILLSPRPQAGHTQPALTVIVEDSADGSSWATVATFTFTASDQQSAAVDSPRAYLRASWTDVAGTWAVDVAVKSIATPASGGGSMPTVVLYDPDGGDTINAGNTNYAAPFSTWTVARDDVGALQPNGYGVILPSGLWLCGAVIDTSDDWTGATGIINVGVVGGSLALIANVPWPGSIPVGQQVAAFHAAPTMVWSTGAEDIVLKAGNQTNQAAHLSGEVLWALKVADAP